MLYLIVKYHHHRYRKRLFTIDVWRQMVQIQAACYLNPPWDCSKQTKITYPAFNQTDNTIATDEQVLDSPDNKTNWDNDQNHQTEHTYEPVSLDGVINSNIQEDDRPTTHVDYSEDWSKEASVLTSNGAMSRMVTKHECKYCGISYDAKHILRKHMQVHEAHVISSDECSSNNDDGTDDLSSRKSTVTKPLIYDDKGLDSDSNHSSSSTYQCGYCDDAFLVEIDLRTHMKAHYQEVMAVGTSSEDFATFSDGCATNKQMFSCEYCGKAFDKDSSRKKHAAMHLKLMEKSERSFAISMCSPNSKIGTQDTSTHTTVSDENSDSVSDDLVFVRKTVRAATTGNTEGTSLKKETSKMQDIGQSDCKGGHVQGISRTESEKSSNPVHVKHTGKECEAKSHSGSYSYKFAEKPRETSVNNICDTDVSGKWTDEANNPAKNSSVQRTSSKISKKSPKSSSQLPFSPKTITSPKKCIESQDAEECTGVKSKNLDVKRAASKISKKSKSISQLPSSPETITSPPKKCIDHQEAEEFSGVKPKNFDVKKLASNISNNSPEVTNHLPSLRETI